MRIFTHLYAMRIALLELIFYFILFMIKSLKKSQPIDLGKSSMMKPLIALLVISVCILIGEPYVKSLMLLLWNAHTHTTDALSHIFSGDHDGRLARDWIALIVVPLGIAAIPNIFFWLVRRRLLPYTIEIIWATWLLQVGMMMGNGH